MFGKLQKYSKEDIRMALMVRNDEYIYCLMKIFSYRNSTGNLEEWVMQLYKCYQALPMLRRCRRNPKAKYIYKYIFGGIEDVFPQWINNLTDDVERECRINVVYSNREKLFCFVKSYSYWISQQLSLKGIVSFDEVKGKIECLLK